MLLSIYILGPYRIACVAAGSFVAFFWLIFPYPISDRSWLRKDLANTLYLLANFYSVVHSVSRGFIVSSGTDSSISLADIF
jgi:hypothetical protein